MRGARASSGRGEGHDGLQSARWAVRGSPSAAVHPHGRVRPVMGARPRNGAEASLFSNSWQSCLFETLFTCVCASVCSFRVN